jgi:hypothetical protein
VLPLLSRQKVVFDINPVLLVCLSLQGLQQGPQALSRNVVDQAQSREKPDIRDSLPGRGIVGEHKGLIGGEAV